jgi:hypothetical protein
MINQENSYLSGEWFGDATHCWVQVTCHQEPWNATFIFDILQRFRCDGKVNWVWYSFLTWWSL